MRLRSVSNVGSMSANSNNDVAYNILLDGTATHNFGRDLTSRLDLRYTYEDQESNGVSGSGNTLTLPGLLDLGNAYRIGQSSATCFPVGNMRFSAGISDASRPAAIQRRET